MHNSSFGSPGDTDTYTDHNCHLLTLFRVIHGDILLQQSNLNYPAHSTWQYPPLVRGLVIGIKTMNNCVTAALLDKRSLCLQIAKLMMAGD